MIRKIFFLGLISLILLSSAFINLKVLKSFIEQNMLIYEFNAYQTRLPLDAVKTFNDNFPNITMTTLPLKMLKARYFMKDSLVEESLNLLKKAKKENPFLGINDFYLGNYYYKKENLDSAFFYSRNAFKALPRNGLHSRLYFQVLAKLKYDSILDESFNQIKEFYILDQWRDYLFSKVEIGVTPKEELSKILEEAESYVSDKKKFMTLQTIINVGAENLGELGQIIIEAETSYSQGEFIEAANSYQKASRLDPYDYTHFENAALSYYRGDYFEEAENLFTYTLRTFDVSNGKSELYLGLLMYELEKKDKACEFWNISRQKGFSGSQRVIDTFCK